MTLPIVITTAGLQPRTPTDVQTELIQKVAATNPGYTANLPASLIEDISSTDVAAILECDSAAVELVNSLTPFGANAFLLNQLGQVYGVPIGLTTNTSVLVVFTGPPGYVLAQGFVVSDGANQYTLRDGGIIGGVGPTGTSPQLFAVANNSGSFSVPAGTVTQLATSVPSPNVVTVTNPLPGTPGTGPESEENYRADVLQAGQAISQGMTTYLKTLLRNVSGVQSRLISVRQIIGVGWEVIVGGGDPYQIADAIFVSLFNINTLVGSTLHVAGFTAANPGVVTTDLNHNFSNGQVVTITAVNPANYNNTYTITVTGTKTFSVGVSTVGFPAYVSGGVVSPSLRNVSVNINDYPDVYTIPFVNPPQQTVTMTVTWNTTATNFVSAAAVAQLAAPAIVAYINSLGVGLPMNQFVLNDVFQDAVASILDKSLLTRLVFAVSINGVSTPAQAGTGIIAGDPESYFQAVITGITVVQG